MKDNEWYSPSHLVEEARKVMGHIELDPASCALANETVKASRYYTQEQDGLQQNWHAATVWLNPPYGHVKIPGLGNNKSHQQAFAQKLLTEMWNGQVEEAILLSLGNPNSKWFQPFFDHTICFLSGHTNFRRADGRAGHFGFPLAIVYLGPHTQRFIDEFKAFGCVVQRVDKAAHDPTNERLLFTGWQNIYG